MNAEVHANINIYKYLDYRLYLKDLYLLRKEQNSYFSYTTWAQAAGFKGRSYIRLVISGKRNLTVSALEKLLPTLKLKIKDENFFRALVSFTQASKVVEREFYWQEILKLMNVSVSNHQIDTYTFFSSHWCPKILTMIMLGDIELTTEAIANAFSLSEKDTKRHLATLESLEMVTLIDGRWRATHSSCTVNSEYNNFAMQTFHKNSLLQAIEKLELNSNERFFNSLLLSLNEEQYGEAVGDLEKFIQFMRTKYAATSGKDKKLYQLNLNNVPISNKYIHLAKKDEPVFFKEQKNNMELR